MFKVIVKTFVKVLLALGAVFGVLLLLRHLNEQKKSDYIDIYNDDEEGDLF